MRGKTVAERYELGEQLGEGGMGTVYEATHSVTGKRLALKLMAPDMPMTDGMITRFRREARAAGLLDTEHIVQVFDSGIDEGMPYIAMELLVGESLKELEERLGPLPPELALKILAQACAGVGEAHRAGVIHRDLKPSNLFIARQGKRLVVKVLDFGIAKLDPRLRETSDERDLTRTGTVLGTPHYMAPEQVQAQEELGPAADVWALGIVLYEALCGERPHETAKTLMEVMFRTYMQRPEPISKRAPWVTAEIEALLRRALALPIPERFADAATLASALEDLLPDGHELGPADLQPLSDAVRVLVPARERRADDDGTETDVGDPERMRAQWAAAMGERDTELPPLPKPEPEPEHGIDESASGGELTMEVPSSRPRAMWGVVLAVGALAIPGLWLASRDEPTREPATPPASAEAAEPTAATSPASASASAEPSMAPSSASASVSADRPPAVPKAAPPTPAPTAPAAPPPPPPGQGPPGQGPPGQGPPGQGPPSKGLSKDLGEFGG